MNQLPAASRTFPDIDMAKYFGKLAFIVLPPSLLASNEPSFKKYTKLIQQKY